MRDPTVYVRFSVNRVRPNIEMSESELILLMKPGIVSSFGFSFLVVNLMTDALFS